MQSKIYHFQFTITSEASLSDPPTAGRIEDCKLEILKWKVMGF